MFMPLQKPGRSKQDYGTPPEFLAAVQARFGRLLCDLACTRENRVCSAHFTEEVNSLSADWPFPSDQSWNWLNPPFADIRPWVQKAYEHSLRGGRTLVLIPASVGANWWRDWVHEKAGVHFLNGRLQFVGTDGLYPKDCALLEYYPNAEVGIREGVKFYHVWTWKDDVPRGG